MKYQKSDITMKKLSRWNILSYFDKFVYLFLFSLFFTSIIWFIYHLFLLKSLWLISFYVFLLFLMPLVFIVYSKKIIFLLFRIFFKFKSFEIEKFDLYTNDVELTKELYTQHKHYISFVTFPLSSVDKYYKMIQQKFIELSYFWYATEIDLVKFRFFLPILSFVLSIFFFLSALYILDNIEFSEHYNNIFKIALIIIFLTILYLSMITHINMFLNPEFYKNEIYKLFKISKISFLNSNISKNILLYLEKNFLIKIFDTKYNTQVTINNNERFEKFVLNEDIDHEGKKYIVNIFVFMFMIIYATIFIEVLIDDDVEKVFKYHQEYNITIDDKKHNISFVKDKP